MDLRGYGVGVSWWVWGGWGEVRGSVGLEDRRWMGDAANKPPKLELCQ